MQLVTRTLATLRELGRSGPRSMQDLASAVNIPLPSMHRLLASMEAQGFVLRTPDRRFVLGPEALALAAGARPLEQISRPHLEALAARTGATTFLTEMLQGRAMCTALAQGSGALRLFVHVGQEMPIHAASSARVLLHGMPEAQVRDLLLGTELTAFTEGTPVAYEEVRAHLELITTQGYDVCANELDPGVVAISAPINGPGGVQASLTIAAPDARARGNEEEWAALLLDAAALISRESGGAPAAVTPSVATPEAS